MYNTGIILIRPNTCVTGSTMIYCINQYRNACSSGSRDKKFQKWFFFLLTIVGSVFPVGPVCLAWPMGPTAGPIWPGLAWFCPMPMPCPWAEGCCWGPAPAGAPGCPGLAAAIWACCWSWVFCPGPISDWGLGPLCLPDPGGPPAEPWARAELLPDLEEPGWGRDFCIHEKFVSFPYHLWLLYE